MNTKRIACHQILMAIAGLLAIAPVVQASTVTVTGSNVTLLSANHINGRGAATHTTQTSSPGNLNHFVGSANVANNSFYSTLSANIAPSDTNAWMMDFGALANGASANRAFSIFDQGDLGITNFSFSFLTGDDISSISRGNIALAGGFSRYNAEFLAQNAPGLTNFSGVYRLLFTDDVYGLSQFDSNSFGSNYIDLNMTTSIAPSITALATVPEPNSLALMGLGFGLIGVFTRRRKPV